jgi:hypothetical protein
MTRKKSLKTIQKAFPKIMKGNGGRALLYTHKIPIGWKNHYTKCVQKTTGVAFFADASFSGNVYVVLSIADDATGEVIFEFAKQFFHPNIYTSLSDIYIVNEDGDKYRLKGQKFCTGDNGIYADTLIKKPDVVGLTLAHIITTTNLGSPANTSLTSVSNFEADYYTGIDPNKGSISQLITSMTKPTPSELRTARMRGVENEVLAKPLSKNTYQWVDKDRIDISKVYPVFAYGEVMEATINIPKEEVEFICLGLGSAGGGVLEQLGRTKLLEKYFVCDMDKIENKNLRNQPFLDFQVGISKAFGMNELLGYRFGVKRGSIKFREKRFQECGLRDYKTKYLMLGFDSIKTRLEAFQYVLDGEIEAQYIIDTRYDGLEASIYMVSTSDEKEMEYYHQQLTSDSNMLEPAHTFKRDDEVFIRLLEYIKNCGCQSTLSRLGMPRYPAGRMGAKTCGLDSQCRSAECVAGICEWLNKYGVTKNKVEEVIGGGTSCVAWDIIDIYKFASSFITSAVREIENNKPKQFTHVEVTTDGMPKIMVIKK